jgi:hypothetical protein
MTSIVAYMLKIYLNSLRLQGVNFAQQIDALPAGE